MNNKRRIVIGTAAAVVVLAATVLINVVRTNSVAAATPPPPPVVQVAAVERRDIPVQHEWIGTVTGLVNAAINAQVTGYLLRQDYTEGSFVHKGQLLFEIDPRPFQAAVDQAAGQLAQSKAQLAQAQAGLIQAQAQLVAAEANQRKSQLDEEKYAPLFEQNAVTRQELDNAVQTNQSNKAQVGAARAQVETSKAQIEAASAAVTAAQLHPVDIADRWDRRRRDRSGRQPGQRLESRGDNSVHARPSQSGVYSQRAGVSQFGASRRASSSAAEADPRRWNHPPA